MQNYKISVSKDWKKYNIVFKAENEAAARTRVHKEWYSILSVQEISEKNAIWWSAFIFEWYKDWEFKHWKIVWEDIFKAYIKLRKDLEYQVDLLYHESDKDLELEKKKELIWNLEEEYNIYYSSWKKERIDEIRDKIKKERSSHEKMENFFMKKELDETTKLIELVLKKLEKIISWNYPVKFSQEKIEKLKQIYNEIIKLKKSTNISKLKEIWEIALLKIWTIELKEVEKSKNEESRALLKETNKLLKSIGSKDQFIEKDKDIVYQLKNLSNNISNFFKSFKWEKKVSTIDKDSHSYIKNLLYLSKYRDRLKQNNSFILKNIVKIILSKNIREETFIKREVIKQNITLLHAREKWVSFSYTYVKKWIKTINREILLFFSSIKKYIFAVIFVYVILFFTYINISQILELKDYNFSWIYGFVIIILIYLLLKISKNIFLLILNFVFLIFIIIFGVINF